MPFLSTPVKLLKKVVCGKVLKLPLIKKVAKCDIGLDVTAAKLEIKGTVSGSIDECKMTKTYNGGGSLTGENFGLTIGVTLSVFPGDDGEDLIKGGGTLSVNFDFNGTIKAKADKLLLTVMLDDLRLTGSLKVPFLPISIPFDEPLAGGGTTHGPFTMSSPDIPTNCEAE